MEEIWRDIEGYEGIYQVSNLGRVKSMRFKKERILKSVVRYNGYVYFELRLNKKIKYKSLHRLIATAFIVNDNNKPCVNHIDGNKLNNDISNLEWVTYSENNKHAYDNGLKQGASKRKVKCVELNAILESARGAAKKFGLFHQNILKCCNGLSKTTGGYHWEYVND